MTAVLLELVPKPRTGYQQSANPKGWRKVRQTSFHAYYTARLLDNPLDDDLLAPAFASSDIRIYPFQIAAAAFALRSPYQNGAILCDEAGMGKSHEAMLVITQKWLNGYDRILLYKKYALRQCAEIW